MAYPLWQPRVLGMDFWRIAVSAEGHFSIGSARPNPRRSPNTRTPCVSNQICAARPPQRFEETRRKILESPISTLYIVHWVGCYENGESCKRVDTFSLISNRVTVNTHRLQQDVWLTTALIGDSILELLCSFQGNSCWNPPLSEKPDWPPCCNKSIPRMKRTYTWCRLTFMHSLYQISGGVSWRNYTLPALL